MNIKEFNQFIAELEITIDEELDNDQFKKLSRLMQEKAYGRFAGGLKK